MRESSIRLLGAEVPLLHILVHLEEHTHTHTHTHTQAQAIRRTPVDQKHIFNNLNHPIQLRNVWP
jgi:hypothetical protein